MLFGQGVSEAMAGSGWAGLARALVAAVAAGVGGILLLVYLGMAPMIYWAKHPHIVARWATGTIDGLQTAVTIRSAVWRNK
jgi:hypothetical protein